MYQFARKFYAMDYAVENKAHILLLKSMCCICDYYVF